MLQFSHISAARLFWFNQFGRVCRNKPDRPTWMGDPLKDERIFGSDETQVIRAIRQGKVDTWRPKAVFHTTGHHRYELVDGAALRTFHAYKRWARQDNRKEVQRARRQLELAL